jgi:excisionase family DNA binding protein
VETYLSIEGLAKYLDVAEKSIRKWVLNREIPYHKVMKLIRFRLSEIEQWIETNGKFPQANDDEALEDELFGEDEAGETSDNPETAGTGGAA